jgi:hypothetical protein
MLSTRADEEDCYYFTVIPTDEATPVIWLTLILAVCSFHLLLIQID